VFLAIELYSSCFFGLPIYSSAFIRLV
jgi:hypothetical protein